MMTSAIQKGKELITPGMHSGKEGTALDNYSHQRETHDLWTDKGLITPDFRPGDNTMGN